MRFFSKIVFISNLCFVAAAIFRLLEISKEQSGNHDAVIPLPALQGSMVVLGYGSIFFNIIFALLLLIFFLLKKQHHVAGWLVWVNLLFFVFQLFYFKLY